MPQIDGELKGAQLESLSSTSPTPAARGRVYLDISGGSSLGVPKIYTGSGWNALRMGNNTVYDAGNSSTAITINWSNGLLQKLTLTGHCAVTFSNPVAGEDHVLLVEQSASTRYRLWFPYDVGWGRGNPTEPYIPKYGREMFVFKRLPTAVTTSITLGTVASPHFITAGNAAGLQFNPVSMMLAGTDASSPYAVLYDADGGVLGSKFADPAALPPGTCTDVCFHPSGLAVAYASTASVYNKLYQFRNKVGFGAAYTETGTDPTGAAQSVSLCEDALAFAHTTTPYVTMYPFTLNGGAGTKATNSGTLPAGNGLACRFRPQGDYLAVGYTGSPYFYVYPSAAGVFGSPISAPGTAPSTNVSVLAWSPSGNYLAVGGAITNSILVYPFAAGVFGTVLTYESGSAAPASAAVAACWTPDGRYLLVATASNDLSIYFVNDSGKLQTFGGTGPTVGFSPTGISVSCDGEMIAIARAASTDIYYVNAPKAARNWYGRRLMSF